MANRKEAKASEAKAIEAEAPITTYTGDPAELLAAAQLEIEALQQTRAALQQAVIDRELTIGELQAALGGVARGDALLSRDVLADEHDEDPKDEKAGTAGYNAGRKAGLLEAALECETRFAGPMGTMIATALREREEGLS